MHNLLVISDLHLGEDIRPVGHDIDPRLARLEHELVSFLEHYTANRRGTRPWKLVINGDMVDFIAVCLMPDEAGQLVNLHPDDHLYGLGGSRRAAAAKMQRVLDRHRAVFAAMAAFLGAGNQLAVVHGNHDAEFHWPEVQRLLRTTLARLWTADPASRMPDAPDADALRQAIRFHPWFYLEPGVAWIEHGHQYDPYCSFDDILEPATDRREVDVNVGAAIMRYVAVHFTDDIAAHWGSGFFGYLTWWWAQGLHSGLAILGGYRDMILRLVAGWSVLRAEPVRERARQRLKRISRAARVPVEVLVRLRALRHPPMVSGLRRIVQAVMLDRLLLLVGAPILLVVLLVAVPWAWWPSALIASSAVVVPWLILAGQRREPVDPRRALRAMARVIRRHVKVPIVVFGHSHVPTAEGGVDGWYFNTGSWLPYDNDRGLLRAFTHVLIERTERGLRARLCQWREGRSRAWDRRLPEARLRTQKT